MEGKTRIPVFRTVQEEAEFWDNHSVADFWEELEPEVIKPSDELTCDSVHESEDMGNCKDTK